MAIGGCIPVMVFYQGRNQDYGNSPTATFSQAAAGSTILALVPVQHNQVFLALLFKRRNQFIELVEDPGVGDNEFAVVRIITHIRGDEDEVRQRSGLDIRFKILKRNDTAL